MTLQPTIFLDRDGVIIEDVHLLTKQSEIHLYEESPHAIQALRQAGFKVIVVSNQPVVARGLVTEDEVREVNEAIQDLLVQAGGAPVDAFYFCPHHPNATLPAYRLDCDCRKPRPGLLLQAAREYNLDLASSFMIGDRLTDILAGRAAGCHTILVQTGMHTAKPIETSDPLDTSAQPDFTCANLQQAADWILETTL
jgi:D-glycero-D-manno-heptose 1,7-bisphosphate phosphatase